MERNERINKWKRKRDVNELFENHKREPDGGASGQVSASMKSVGFHPVVEIFQPVQTCAEVHSNNQQVSTTF